ncbi:MAG: hypothetical protein AAGU16_15540, partial [Desulfitobacterium hafniense]
MPDFYGVKQALSKIDYLKEKHKEHKQIMTFSHNTIYKRSYETTVRKKRLKSFDSKRFFTY